MTVFPQIDIGPACEPRIPGAPVGRPQPPDDGTIVDGELLRPAEWVDSQGVTAGCEVDFQLPELQLTGTARVDGIDRCPPLASGDGRVVTGRFVTRSVDATIRVLLDGDHEIRGTEVHPVWSMDRSDWVPLGELVPGERLLGKEGAVCVVQSEVVSSPVPVYNIETHGEHVYRIGLKGVLVHNVCPGDGPESSALVRSALEDLPQRFASEFDGPVRTRTFKAGEKVFRSPWLPEELAGSRGSALASPPLGWVPILYIKLQSGKILR